MRWLDRRGVTAMRQSHAAGATWWQVIKVYTFGVGLAWYVTRPPGWFAYTALRILPYALGAAAGLIIALVGR